MPTRFVMGRVRREGGHQYGHFHWPGVIQGQTRILEPASTLDVFLNHWQSASAGRSLRGWQGPPSWRPAPFGEVAPFRFLYSYHDNRFCLGEGP